MPGEGSVVVVVICFVELKAPSLVPSHNSLLHIILLILYYISYF